MQGKALILRMVTSLVNPAAEESIPQFHFGYENVLGTSLDLRVDVASATVAEAIEERVLAEIDRLEAIFSIYNPGSEFRQWREKRGIPTPVSPELWTVLQACDFWRARTGEAFHPAGEAFLQIWREASDTARLPDEQRIASLRKQTSANPWKLDGISQTATCLAEFPLSLNAIAKGYIVDRACEAAFTVSDGVQGIVLNIGGDLRVRSRHPEWVGITNPNQDAENAPPLACVKVQNAALATSGDWRRGFPIGENWYSHIIDPRTGYPSSQIRSASVIAPQAMDADALATAFSVLAPEESLVLADSLLDVGCLLVTSNGLLYRNAYWCECEASLSLG